MLHLLAEALRLLEIAAVDRLDRAVHRRPRHLPQLLVGEPPLGHDRSFPREVSNPICRLPSSPDGRPRACGGRAPRVSARALANPVVELAATGSRLERARRPRCAGRRPRSPRSSLKSSRSSRSGSSPARISRATTAQTLAATRTLKRCSRGTSGRSSANRYSATESRSSAAVGRSCIRTRHQLEQVPLGLADPAAERGELVAASHAGQVVVGLAGADHCPLDVPERLPVAHPIRGRRARRRPPRRPRRIIELPHARHRAVVVAEPPGADAEPADVLGRIAEVGELPVDHRREAVRDRR